MAPNNARIWYCRGIAAGSGGNHAASFEYLARAESLDPLSNFIRVARALLMYYANRMPEGITRLQEVLKLAPDQVTGYWILGMTQAAAGDYDASIGNSESAVHYMGRLGRALAYLGFAYARSGRIDQARAVLAELESRPGQYMPPYFGAVVLHGLGDTEAALARLERARAEHDTMLRDVRVDRVWDSLRENPRFAALSAQMRFPGDPSGPTRKIDQT